MRPSTLYQAVEGIIEGQPIEDIIPEFVDEYNGRKNNVFRQSMIEREPRLTGNVRTDAMVAAIAEFLAKQWRLEYVPDWVSKECRVLEEPWFTVSADDPGMREYLCHSSPAEFVHHNIFTTEAPLSRPSSGQGREDLSTP